MAAVSYAPSDQSVPASVFTAATAAALQTTATARANSYCWTHGTSNNSQHNSTTCQHPAENHQSAATVANKMGGSTRVHPKNTSSGLVGSARYLRVTCAVP
eukprot:scaffold23207_cov51-Attheya_sp.AAC.1